MKIKKILRAMKKDQLHRGIIYFESLFATNVVFHKSPLQGSHDIIKK